MPNSCAAINCTNRANKKRHLSFYKFPLRDEKLTKKWVLNMKRKDWYPTKSSYLCSEHFEDKFMYYTNDQRRLLNKAVPTLFSFPQLLQKEMTKRAPPKKRYFSETEAAEIPDPAVQLDPNGRNIAHDHSYSLSSPKKIMMLYDRIMGKSFLQKKKMKLVKQTVYETKKRLLAMKR